MENGTRLDITILLLYVKPREDDFQSGNHKDKSSQGEIMKKKTTSKRSVFQDPSFIRSLRKVSSFPIDLRSRSGRCPVEAMRKILKYGVSLERLFKSGVSFEDCKLEAKSPRGCIGTIIQLYCLKAWFGSLELVEPQAWD
ncbi:hypothetical protein CK203_050709 [Vitis vinifera]|uniref:Uncharacterized protein n=1 Tax=Vitis vinifera TaxID=29760 RepID=A0A438H8Q6_VITVI|nr:hypothetical protein CK203_050709 [Vitis vinifera]